MKMAPVFLSACRRLVLVYGSFILLFFLLNGVSSLHKYDREFLLSIRNFVTIRGYDSNGRRPPDPTFQTRLPVNIGCIPDCLLNRKKRYRKRGKRGGVSVRLRRLTLPGASTSHLELSAVEGVGCELLSSRRHWPVSCEVYKKQASASVCALGRRLREQEEDFAGKSASYQREIRHLQNQLRDRQEQLHGALQQKREVEGELEVVWEAATRESQRLREVVLRSSSLSPVTVAPALHSTSGRTPARIPHPEDHLSCSLPSPFISRESRLPHPSQCSPMFDSDSDQHQNPSSDESDKSGRDS